MLKIDFSEDFDCFDDEYRDFSQEQDKELLDFATNFFGDLKCLINQYLQQFFKDKDFHCGGKISKAILNTDRNISIVANYDIINGVQKAYSSLEKHPLSSESLGEVTGDIRLVSSILQELARSSVPQQFAGGMMLLYLELIMGIDIGK
jgi:hypothetical protein